MEKRVTKKHAKAKEVNLYLLKKLEKDLKMQMVDEFVDLLQQYKSKVSEEDARDRYHGYLESLSDLSISPALLKEIEK
jgi:hypothetical protein